mmetsp:Transcript_24253/g.50418  ORF Transcript_24253/g.50418 Transcript_24253/m.50418 type:complete len:83 (+) Transcript_24253:1264-1512(+)
MDKIAERLMNWRLELAINMDAGIGVRPADGCHEQASSVDINSIRAIQKIEPSCVFHIFPVGTLPRNALPWIDSSTNQPLSTL